MLKKIIDITFWVSFISTLMHFFVWTLIKDAPDAEFTKDMFNMMFLSGGVTMLAYWTSKPPPFNSDNDKNY